MIFHSLAVGGVKAVALGDSHPATPVTPRTPRSVKTGALFVPRPGRLGWRREIAMQPYLYVD